MGFIGDIFKDVVKANIYGHEVRKSINTIKGDTKTYSCEHCGQRVNKIKASCQYSGFWDCCGNGMSTSARLCDKCAKRCKKCSKYFCPIHIHKHNCQ